MTLSSNNWITCTENWSEEENVRVEQGARYQQISALLKPIT